MSPARRPRPSSPPPRPDPASRPAVRLRRPTPPGPATARGRPRSQRLAELRRAYGMPVRWAKEVLAGRATVEEWLAERARQKERQAAAAQETLWLLEQAQDLAFFTYTGVRRAALAEGLRALPPYAWPLASGEQLAKLAVVAVMAGEAGEVRLWLERLHPERSWVESVRSQGLRPARRPGERPAFPPAELEPANGKVEVVTLDGRCWRGQLQWDSRYAFLLDTSAGPALVLKHAVHVQPAQPSPSVPRAGGHLVDEPALPRKKKSASLRTTTPAPARSRRPEPPLPEQLLHRYWLRPERQIQLRLPSNLSRSEAERLADWVRQLPRE